MKGKKILTLLMAFVLISLTGCGVGAPEDDTKEPVSQLEDEASASVIDDDSIAERDTESAVQPTESEMPESNKVLEASAAPQTPKPAETAPPQPSAVSSPTEQPKPTEPPRPTPSPEPTEQPQEDDPPEEDGPIVTEETEPTPPPEPEKTDPTPTPTPTVEEPVFDIGYWISYAQNYAQSVGLRLESYAVECWDNPITAGPHSTCLERDIQGMLGRYAGDEDITDVWIWSESIGNGEYNIYIGYA